MRKTEAAVPRRIFRGGHARWLYLIAAVCLSVTAWCGSAQAVQWSYLSNGTIKIGAITDWGAGIGYFSRVSQERNLLNYADKGREVQQSYYGSSNGLTWSGTPWRWNPVQAGDAYNNPSTVQTLTNDGTTLYAKVIPKDWAANNVSIAGYMEQWITLSGDVAKIHFKFTYTGSTTQSSADQELPAMFVDYALPNLVTYRGSAPWTNGATTSIVPADLVGTSNATNFSVTEPWQAYVDNSGWGIGMYTPGNITRRTSYRYSQGSSGPTGFACSYVAPVGTWSFSPTVGTNKGPVYEYDVYLTIGTLSEIRSRFYALHNGTPAADTTAPTVSITAPANNSTASGTVSVTANATDNVGVSKVEFYLNNSLVATDTTTPYLYSWNTSGLAAGSYGWTAKAYDAAGNVAQSAKVTVNVAKDTTAPTVSLTAPTSGSTVSGTRAITATASDNLGVSKVEFYANGTLLNATNVSPYSYNWDTTGVANGSYTLTAKAYDAAGNVAQSSGSVVTVSNTATYTAVFGNATGSTYLNTVEDTFLNINYDVNAATTYLNAYTWPASKPANAILMKWNLSALPAGAQIQSATLSLYQTGWNGDSSYEMPVSKIINKNPTLSKSTGYTYDGSNAWTASSLPYNGIPLAQADIAAPVDAPLVNSTNSQYKNWNVTSMVRDWVANPSSNFGLMIDSSAKASADSSRTFASSESTNAGQRPKLTVTYTLK